MIVFTVHEPPNPPADRIDRAEKLEFVRDGFSPLAAAIPPLWLALHKLWIALLIYLLAATALSLALKTLGVDNSLIGLINFAANIVIGFEADSIKRWTLGRRGWGEVGTVAGRNRAECERRFFDGWLERQPVLRTSSARSSSNEGYGGRIDGDGAGGVGERSAPTIAPARPLWRRLLRR